MPGKFLNNAPLMRLMPWEAGYNRKRPWLLVEDLRYECGLLDGEILIVPAGYTTDFASVPWACRRMFPQDGPWTHAAILHDLLCDWQLPGISSKIAADIFLEAMEALDVPQFQRSCMYRAVRWFGPRWP